jgi:DNA-binding NtrC family response regulator
MLKTKILIVDDEPVVREVCKVILRSDGFEPLLAINGREGLETYQQRHQEICLVLSDIKMPVMNGIEMVREIFEVDAHANVILMSGANLDELVPDQVRRLCSVINKPFTPDGCSKP